MAILSRRQPWRRPPQGGAEILRGEFADGLIYAAGYQNAPLGQTDGSAYFGRGDTLSNNLAQQRGSMHGYYVGDIPPRVSTPYGPALLFSGAPSGGIVSKSYTQSIVGAANGASVDESCVVVCSLGSSSGSQAIMGFANVWSTSLADYGRGIGVEGGLLMAWGASAQNGKKITATLPDLNKPIVIAARFGVNGCLMVDGRIVATGDTSHSWAYNLSVGIAIGIAETSTVGAFNGIIGPRHWWRRGLSNGQLMRASELARAMLQPRRRRLFVVSSGTSPVTTDFSATYAVQSTATSDSAATYAIREAVSADLGASFAVRAAAESDASASFVVRGSASADAAASFVIRGAVSTDSAASYAVRTSATADLAAAFVVGSASVTTDLPTSYAIRGSATSDSAASYAVRGSASSDSVATFAIRTSAQADRAASFVVLGAAQADAASSYAIRTAASSDLAGAFSILNAGVVVTDLGASFSIRGAAQSDAAAAFSIRTLAETDRSAAYAVRGAAQTDLVGAYDVINALAVSADLSATWTVTGSILRDLFASYAVGEVLAEASPGFTAGGAGAPLVARFAPPTFRGN